jgi:acetyl-CoA acyltransferase
VFAAKGSVTAGNSSQTSDGAGALILASEKAIKQFDLKPLARFVSFAARGVPPEIMGIGPIEAIPAALRYAGLNLKDMGWIELNEAFAAQSLAVIRTLGWTRPRSTRWAAPSRWATRWAPPVPSAPPPWCTRCAATS